MQVFESQELFELLSTMPPEEAEAAINCVLGELSLAEFIRIMWPIEHSEVLLLWNWHIDCLSEHLEACFHRLIRYLLINIPPGFMKSLIVSVYFPAWVWLHRPYEQFLVTSSTDEVVYRDARRHMETCTSDLYRRIFMPQWCMNRNQAAKGYFVNSANGHRISRTVGQGMVGLRGNYRIADDPNHPRKSMGDNEHLEEVNNFIDGNEFRQRKNHSDDPMIVVQQRLAQNDVTGFLMEKNRRGTVHLSLPNEYVPSRGFMSPINNSATGEPWADPRTKEGELLHPGIQDEEATAEEKSAGDFVYSATQQQDPLPAAGNIFKRDKFRTWVPVETESSLAKGAVVLPPLSAFDYLILAADLNKLEDGRRANKDTDYAVLDIWGARAEDRYLIRQERKKLGATASVDMAMELLQQFPQIRRVLIEKAANAVEGQHGEGVIKTLKRRLGIEEKDDSFVCGISVQGRAKVQRAVDCLPIIEAGRVIVPDPDEYGEMGYWFGEVCNFPARKRDDRVDTMTMALLEMEKADVQVWSVALSRRKNAG